MNQNIWGAHLWFSLHTITLNLKDLYNEFRNQFGDIWELALLKNIEKLKKRYPDEYTDDKANNRNLQAENKVLKQ
jgi:hypothetical protein